MKLQIRDELKVKLHFSNLPLDSIKAQKEQFVDFHHIYCSDIKGTAPCLVASVVTSENMSVNHFVLLPKLMCKHLVKTDKIKILKEGCNIVAFCKNSYNELQLLRNKGDTENFDLEKPKLCEL